MRAVFCFVLTTFLMTSESAIAGGTLIAGTSFEEVAPVQPNPSYFDSLDPLTNHFLLNNPGQTAISYTSIGGELGFTAFYTNTRNSTGLSDGDSFGVLTDVPPAVIDPGFIDNFFPDGSQGYWMDDVDGMVTVTFDSVSLAGIANPMVSLKGYIGNTGWELNDVIHIWVTLDDGIGNISTVTLLDTTGLDIDVLGIESPVSTNIFTTYSGALTTNTTATLRVAFDSDISTERFTFDDVRFFDAVPGPGAAGLFCLAFLSRRRKRS